MVCRSTCAGRRADALVAGTPEALARLKARFLGKATVDGTGNSASYPVRSYVGYCVHGIGINPIQPVDACDAVKRLYEGVLEDWAIWSLVFQPTGRNLAVKSMLGYVSTVRAWYHRFYSPGVLGVGAAGGRMADLLKGVAREIPQAPPRERLGCTPEDLSTGMEARYVRWTERDEQSPFPAAELRTMAAEGAMWRSGLTYGMAAIARGCEIALDRDEVFDAMEHVTPGDVSFFYRDGVRHARVRMRKRKDLRVLRGKHSVVTLGGGGAHFDAVEELWQWMQVRGELGLPADGPLWCDPTTGRAITVDRLRDEVRAVMAAAGRDPALYGAHSLRIGGATAALAAGVPPALIRIMGRWSSDVYEIYCRMSEEAALGVGRAIGSAAVTRPEDGFRQEHLEALPHELDDFYPAAARGVAGAAEDEA